MKYKSKQVLKDFIQYCKKHPEQRFWQALTNWSGYNYVLLKELKTDEGVDPFFWRSKTK